MGEIKIIELDFKPFLFKNKIIYYSDSIFDVAGYTSVSFKAVKNKVPAPHFDCREEINYIIDLTQSLEKIWDNMNRNSHRNIKKAKESGVNIKFNQNYEEFYDMYLDHKEAKGHLKWYNMHILDEIKKYGTLVVAEYDDEIISGAVFLEDENNLIYWITASYRYSQNEEIKKLSGNATHLVQWEVIKYAKSKGLKEYNLGPCSYEGNVNKTLLRFKEGLGGKPCKHYTYKKDYNKLYKIIREIYHVIRSPSKIFNNKNLN